MRKPKILVRPSDPLLLDRMIDVCAAAYWLVYTLWAILAGVLGIATITHAAGEFYNFMWSAGIGTFSLVALLTSISLFFDFGERFAPPFKKKVELYAVRCLIILIAVYPVLLFLSAFGGDTVRAPSAVLSLSYLIFPIFRTYVLKKRIITFERAKKEILANDDSATVE